MVLFRNKFGEVEDFDDEFDPETGENLTTNKVKEMANLKGVKVEPVDYFISPEGDKKIYPLSEGKALVNLGWKTEKQKELENHVPEPIEHNKTQSFWEHAGNSAALGTLPYTGAAVDATISKLKGNQAPFSDLYEGSKNIINQGLEEESADNPLPSTLGDFSGNLASFAGGGAKIGANALKNIALGGGLQGATDYNQANLDKKSPSTALKEGGEGALAGGIGAGLGLGAANVLSGAAKVLPKFAGKEGKSLYEAGKRGEDYRPQNVREEIADQAAKLPQEIEAGKESIKNKIGTQKDDVIGAHEGVEFSESPMVKSLLKALKASKNTNKEELITTRVWDALQHIFSSKNPYRKNLDLKKPFNHTPSNEYFPDHPLIETLFEARKELKNKNALTNLSDEKEQIQLATERIEDALGHLFIPQNYNSLKEVDRVKMDLQDPIFDRKSNRFIPDYHVRDILKGPEKKAREMVEDLTPGTKLPQINQGYSDISKAIEPKNNYLSTSPTASDVQNIGKTTEMSLSGRERLNNLKNLHKKITENEALDESARAEMSSLLNKLESISQKHENAQFMEKGHGVKGMMNYAANTAGLGAKEITDLENYPPLIRKIIKDLPVEEATAVLKKLYPAAMGTTGRGIINGFDKAQRESQGY